MPCAMARPIEILELKLEERTELQRRVRAASTPQRDSLRARIVLLRGQGESIQQVAERLQVSAVSVGKWSRRFAQQRLEGLGDRPGRGRKPFLPPKKVEQVILQVTQPPAGRTRWSTRSMAKAVGISHYSVHKIWKQNDLKPHLTRTFKLSAPTWPA